MTEGNGHVIDPNGDARRALLQAVAEHGPEVLSDAAVMDTVCRDHLAGLPGESILIGNAARTNVPALLSEMIPQLGNYGAIQSAATSLAGEHNLDMAASLWVVREYARALGYIAPGTATGTSPSFPGSGPRPVPGSGPRPVPGSGSGSVTGAGEGSGPAEAGREEAAAPGPGGAEAGSAAAEGAAGAAAGVAAGAVAGEVLRDESAGSKASTSGTAAGEEADDGAGTSQGSGAPAATGPIGSSPASTGPMGRTPATGGSQGRPWGEAPPAGGPQDGAPAAGGTGGGGTGGSGPWGGAPGGGAPGGAPGGSAPGGGFPEREPGFPLPLPAGRLPERQRAKVLNRNTVGIAAAIALVAGYLGVAAVAHLSPFPAKTPPPAASSSRSSSPPASVSSSPASSPDPSPTSQFDILLTKIPPVVRDQNNQNSCLNAGTAFGATAVSQCQRLQGVAANVIIYYLYPNRTALASGLSAFLKKQNFRKVQECTTNGSFSDFIVDCRSDFTIKTPGATGSVVEYTSTDQAPVIVSTDNEQNVMAVMVGTNAGDLLAYWNRLGWVVSS